jgi:hypothetical protein
MVLAYVQRLILLVVCNSIEKLIRRCCRLAEQLHLHSGHGIVIDQFDQDVSKVSSPKGKSPQAYVDIFENPHFISTDYKDDRAFVNLANAASHVKTTAHTKNCECHLCRDQRPTFTNGSVGRRSGSRKATKKTKWAPMELDNMPSFVFDDDRIPLPSNPKIRACEPSSEAPLLKDPISLTSEPTLQAYESSPEAPLLNHTTLPTCQPDLSACQWFSEAPLKDSRLRRGNLRVLNSTSNRFAALAVERTEDEDDHEYNIEQDRYHDSEDSSNVSPASPLVARADDHPEKCFSLHPLAELVALLDDETDSDLDASDLEDDFDAYSASAPVSSMAETITTPWQLHPPSVDRHGTNAARSDYARDGGSHTTQDKSRQMPWEEDDWTARKTLGVRALGWTRTRMLWRCTQGEKLELFVGEEML